MNRNFYWGIIVLLAVSFLQTGAVLKKESGIAKAQTDPILFKKKMEELKEGEKGPSMPKMELYGREGAAGQIPVAKGTQSEAAQEKLTEMDEALSAKAGSQSEFDEYWWMEEDSAKKSPPGETETVSKTAPPRT